MLIGAMSRSGNESTVKDSTKVSALVGRGVWRLELQACGDE